MMKKIFIVLRSNETIVEICTDESVMSEAEINGILLNSGSKEENGEYFYEFESQMFDVLNVFWKKVEYFHISHNIPSV